VATSGRCISQYSIHSRDQFIKQTTPADDVSRGAVFRRSAPHEYISVSSKYLHAPIAAVLRASLRRDSANGWQRHVAGCEGKAACASHREWHGA